MSESKPLGFWSCWSLTVGCMIGSGVFLLPSVLAPYGLLSFGGWIVTCAGSILVALTLARLAARTTRTGGPYAFVHDAFGDLLGFAKPPRCSAASTSAGGTQASIVSQ